MTEDDGFEDITEEEYQQATRDAPRLFAHGINCATAASGTICDQTGCIDFGKDGRWEFRKKCLAGVCVNPQKRRC